MRSKLNVLVLLLIPALLWGWGNDVKITTTHGSASQEPVGYDMVWINDTLMFAAIAYNDTIGVYQGQIDYYKSVDAGASWSKVMTWYWDKTKSIDLEYYGDSLYTLWLLENGSVALTIIGFDGNGRTSFSNYTDSTVSGFVKIAERSGNPIIYIATTEATPDADSMTIYRSTDGGNSWEEVYNNANSRVGYIRTLRDFDFTTKSDTILLYYTYERVDTSTNDNNIYTHIYKDDPAGNFNFWINRGISWDATIDSRYPSLTALGPNVLCLYEAGGDILYSFSSDYGDNFTSDIDFPFNTADSSEWAPYAEWWWTFLYGGYNIIFIRGSNLYYVEAGVSGDTVSWDSPVLVSDQHQPSYYLWNIFNYNYRPKLVNKANRATPAVIWNTDYAHFGGTPPVWYYDSTQFYTDNMIAVGVREIAVNSPAIMKLNTFAKNKLHLEFSLPVEQNMKLYIFDVQGRKVREGEILKGTKQFTLDIHNLKPSIYFLRIEDRQNAVTRKFIKVK